MNKKGRLIVVSAPSGCGKDTLVSKYLENHDNSFKSVSATTRQKRGQEKHGVDYYFLTVDQFTRLIKDGGLLEYAKYCDNFYGTPLAPINEHLDKGEDVILVIEVQGAAQIKEKIRDAVTIFIMPPSIDELRKRILGRGHDSLDAVEHRLKRAEEETKFAKDYDYIIVNDELDKAVAELSEIIENLER
jgi:guanylate kinase